MNVALGEVFSPRMSFFYEYDFGTTTELALGVVSEERSEIKGKSIRPDEETFLPVVNSPRVGMCGYVG